jgi:hypothetical protein
MEIWRTFVASHTPGPWEVFVDVAGKLRIDARDGNFSVARVFESASLEGKANAALIAAAPELLATLKALVEELDRYSGTVPGHIIKGSVAVDAARAVVAKLDGSPCPNCDDGCKAEKFCDGCDQIICVGCYAEHNNDLHCHLKMHRACPKCEKCVECEVCECKETSDG